MARCTRVCPWAASSCVISSPRRCTATAPGGDPGRGEQDGADAIDLWPRVHGNQREQLDAMGEPAFVDLLAEIKFDSAV